MDNSEIEKMVKDVFLDVFSEIDENTFNWESRQIDYENWDSFAHLRLVSEIEKKFDLKLDIDDVIYLTSASDFLNLVKRK